MQKMLRAMNDASTWYHPDLFGEFAGVKRYVNKNYADAMKYFEIGAYYADKFSQLSIGLMYVNGEGVPKDMLTGYAWIDIAAERDYPDFVATRDRVKAALTPDDCNARKPSATSSRCATPTRSPSRAWNSNCASAASR